MTVMSEEKDAVYDFMTVLPDVYPLCSGVKRVPPSVLSTNTSLGELSPVTFYHTAPTVLNTTL